MDLDEGNDHQAGEEDERVNETSPLLGDSQSEADDDREQVQDAPRDHYNLVYCVFFLLGMSTLLPWNFFISVKSFWNYKFRDVNITTSGVIVEAVQDPATPPSELQKEFTSYLAIASTVPNALFVILNACFGQRFDLRSRVFTSLSAVIGLFTFVTVLALVNSDRWQRTFLVLILVLVVMINVASAIFQGSTFGMGGKFPPDYIGAQMGGQAMGGVFPAIIDIVVTAMHVEEKNVGFACFLIATIVLIITLGAVSWAFKSPFFKFYNDQESTGSATRNSFPSLVTVISECWLYLLCVFATFTVTLTVYPAVVVLVESENYLSGGTWATMYFTPVCVFLLFNFGDLLGRMISSWLKVPGRSVLGKIVIVLATFVRVAFIPLFMMCNIPTGDPEKTAPFGSDADFVVFMAFFALSNGYIGNICMINGPKGTSDSVMQEAIALVLVAGLVVGTGVGSFLSYPITEAL